MNSITKPLISCPIDDETLKRVVRKLLETKLPDFNTSEDEGNGLYELPEIVRSAPRNYIKIPDTSTVIALTETHKGKDMYKTLEALALEKLKTPTIERFVRYRTNVKEAAEGKRTLLYADGSPVGRDIAEDLWKYMSSGHRGGCWTWLDALFKEENNSWFIETELKVKTDNNGNKYLEGKRKPLEQCVREDCFVSLKFNSQGLPTQISPIQEYNQNENIKFYYPRANSVAWLSANSLSAGLYCGWNPSDANAALGVFACAEGAAQKI